MSILEGSPLPDISSTTTAATTAPSWYDNSLQNIANAGNAAMGYDANGKPIQGFDPASMIAPESSLTTAARTAAPTVAGSYGADLTNAETAASKAATPVGKDQINSFLNPYTQDVVSNLANQSYLNTTNTMGNLAALSGASGQFGSQRALNAGAGALSNINTGLLGEQSKALQSGYTDALNAALKQQGLYNDAAKTYQGLGESQQKLGIAGGNYETDLGGKQTAYNQSILNQPQTAAANAASSLASLKVPSTVTTGYKGPGQSGQYGTSTLGGLTGLLALFAANKGGTSAAGGALDAAAGVADWIKKNLPGSGSDQNIDDLVNSYFQNTDTTTP